MQQHQFISIFTYLFVPKCNLIIHQIAWQFKSQKTIIVNKTAAPSAAAEASVVQQLLLLQLFADSLATLATTKIL